MLLRTTPSKRSSPVLFGRYVRWRGSPRSCCPAKLPFRSLRRNLRSPADRARPSTAALASRSTTARWCVVRWLARRRRLSRVSWMISRARTHRVTPPHATPGPEMARLGTDGRQPLGRRFGVSTASTARTGSRRRTSASCRRCRWPTRVLHAVRRSARPPAWRRGRSACRFTASDGSRCRAARNSEICQLSQRGLREI